MQNKQKAAASLVKCPSCEKTTAYTSENPHRPFCSASCKNMDTIAWAEERFVLSQSRSEKDDGNLFSMSKDPEDLKK